MAKQSFRAKLGYKVGGVAGGGTFSVVAGVGDVTVNQTKGETDITSRDNDGYEATLGALKTVSLEFDMIWDSTKQSCVDIRQAYENDTVIGFAALDGPLASGSGWKFDAQIFDFSRNEPLREGMKIKVVAKPTASDTKPTYVSGGVSAAATSSGA